MPRTLNRSIPMQDTEIYTWFERDRAHVELRHRRNDETIIELMDAILGLYGMPEQTQWNCNAATGC